MNIINRETYEYIADEFSNTRAYVWQCVKDFIFFIQNNISEKNNLKPLILEIGCGNGKNMEYLCNNRYMEQAPDSSGSTSGTSPPGIR